MRNRVNQMHGPYRRPVGVPGAAVSSEAAERWTRPTVARHACGVERGVVGVAHECSLARSASSLSALPNLSSTLPTLAALGAVRAVAANPGRRPARPREARSERSLHRRQLQWGEKRGSGVGPTKRGKGSKIMAIADRHGLPVAVHVVSASPNEATLVEPTLQRRFLREIPKRLIGDKAYDSDPLDQRVREHLQVELIAPHRWNRSRPVTQDGRALRRYRRRWKIERLFAWLHNYRRIVTRWEYYPENFLGMVQLACAVILLRHL
jgi:transposase